MASDSAPNDRDGSGASRSCSPSCAEYWHIGAITMRFGSSMAPSLKGSNSLLIDFGEHKGSVQKRYAAALRSYIGAGFVEHSRDRRQERERQPAARDLKRLLVELPVQAGSQNAGLYKWDLGAALEGFGARFKLSRPRFLGARFRDATVWLERYGPENLNCRLSLDGALGETQRYTTGSSIWTASMYRVAEIVSVVLGACVVPATIVAGLLFLGNF